MKFPSLLATLLLAGLGNAVVVFPKGFKDPFKCGTYYTVPPPFPHTFRQTNRTSDKFDFNKQDNQNNAEAAYQHKDNPIGISLLSSITFNSA